MNYGYGYANGMGQTMGPTLEQLGVKTKDVEEHGADVALALTRIRLDEEAERKVMFKRLAVGALVLGGGWAAWKLWSKK